MNAIERMRKVFRGETPDRVPFFPTIYTDNACVAANANFEDALIDPAFGNACMLTAALVYKTDVVRFIPGPGDTWYKEKRVVKKDGKLVQIDVKSQKEEGFFDVDGGGKFIAFEKPEPVTTVAQVNDINATPLREYVEDGRVKSVKENVERAREKGLFTVGMCGAQTINFMVEKIGDAETALMCFYDNPELARALIAKAVEISIQKARALVEAGVDCVYIGDSYASGSVISPDIYNEFCAPAYKETAARIHEMGVFCYKHCCGNYNPLLQHLLDTGVDAMDGIDPTSGMSVRHTKETIGDKLTLMGGISCLTLLNGTPDEVYKEAAACIAQGKPNGRYVLGSACAVPRFSPKENLLAARQAVEDLGWY